tara:strand:+ start:261 stop:473 length:213 start_codon:yes stop_codon:yes gene_type:complete
MKIDMTNEKDVMMGDKTRTQMEWELALVYASQDYVFSKACEMARKEVDWFCRQNCLFEYNPLTPDDYEAA